MPHYDVAEPVRVVFMGTPDFAVPTLRALLESERYRVVGVVTQPDRPAGRGRTLRPSPVKAVALEAGVPIAQPRKTHEPSAFAQLQTWAPDFLVVVAFGQILRQAVLDLARVMPTNVHASLLPRWRGAAPIQYAIRAGDAETGITTMQMDAGMDTGPILLQETVPIVPNETGQSLHDKLAPLGAKLLIRTLDGVLSGAVVPRPQPDDAALVSYAPMLKKEEGALNWAQSAAEIDRHVRAFFPWPGTYTHWGEKRLKIVAGFPAEDMRLEAAPGQVLLSAGTPLQARAPLMIATGNGVYVPTRLQLAGRKAQDARAFLNGAPEIVGAVLE